jgi:hypothetical protein
LRREVLYGASTLLLAIWVGFEACGKEKSDLGAFTTPFCLGDLIAQHESGIHKGFAYGWDENGSPTFNCLGTYFLKDKCIIFIFLLRFQS